VGILDRRAARVPAVAGCESAEAHVSNPRTREAAAPPPERARRVTETRIGPETRLAALPPPDRDLPFPPPEAARPVVVAPIPARCRAPRNAAPPAYQASATPLVGIAAAAFVANRAGRLVIAPAVRPCCCRSARP